MKKKEKRRNGRESCEYICWSGKTLVPKREDQVLSESLIQTVIGR
jgi:hypothetical protein